MCSLSNCPAEKPTVASALWLFSARLAVDPRFKGMENKFGAVYYNFPHAGQGISPLLTQYWGVDESF